MSKLPRRAPRGQSLVETALGLIVFVSILVWGIHLAELGYLAPKVHEAAANALWDTTAKRMHQHPNDYSPREQAINSAGSDATGRFASFDGRESKKSGDSTVKLVFTEARGLNVTCESDQVTNMSQNNYQAYPGGSGGMACHGSAQLRVINFPKSFLDQGGEGFFKVKNYPNLGWFTFCAMGMASGGDCSQGRVAIMLDDWGLSGGAESTDHLLHSGGNDAFSGLVRNVYGQTGASGMGAGQAMAMAIVNAAPGSLDGTFWMSYQSGKPDPEFRDGDSGPNDWMTNVRTGSRNSKYKDRGNRWLGL
jgi:hypothetical protein